MISKWQWIFSQLGRMLWVRASLYALLGVGAALLATAAQRFWPGEAPMEIGAGSVGDILEIMASSMLAVTTFSLTVMVSAYGTVTSNISPRATRLLLQDSTTQNALGTFLGAFLFSLVGVIALGTEIYGERGRLVMFGFTVLVIALIVVTIVRWIDHLSGFGRMEDAAGRVEAAALAALRSRVDHPSTGTSALFDPDREIPSGALPIFPRCTGYVQHVDIGGLSEWAQKHDSQVYLICKPGAFVDPDQPLAWVATGRQSVQEVLCKCFAVGPERSFDQDPRFGLTVLAEIGSRALSPGINDPGTAIDILGRGVRIFSHWKAEQAEGPLGRLACARVHVTPTSLDDAFDDLFLPLARDGAAVIEVQVRLLKCLAMLARHGGDFALNARRCAEVVRQHSELALGLEQDRQRLRRLVHEVDMAAQLVGRPASQSVRVSAPSGHSIF